MTISPDEPHSPGWQHPPCDDQHPAGDDRPDNRPAQQQPDDPNTLPALAGRVLSSSATTVRCVAVLVVLLGLIIVGLLVLPIDIQLGPLSVRRR